MYKISIIIPIYKVEKYLKRCVDSILNQCDDNIEIILVDDGSPDQCPAICDQYAGKYSNIVVIHKENGGLASAVKEGTLVASAKHIAYVDSDDWLEPNWYTDVVGVLDKYPNIDTIFYGFQRVENEEIKNGNLYSLFEEGYYSGSSLERVKRSYMMPGGVGPTRWNKVYSSEIAHKCLEYYDTRISIGEDMIFSAISTDLMKDTYILKKPYVNYYINSGSMTQHFNTKYESSFEVLFESLHNYFGEKSVLYYVHYINMRTMVNAIGKSDYKNKRHYLNKIMKNNRDRLKKVDKGTLAKQDKFMLELMIHCLPLTMLSIASIYRRFHR